MPGARSPRPARSSPSPKSVRAPERFDLDSRAALAAALDPIITIDAFGVIESASESVARVFGWTPGELIGRNISVIMPEPYRSAHDGYLARYAATGTTRVLNTNRRFEAVRKDGSCFPIELSVSRADIPTRAGPLFIGIVRDLSDSTRCSDRDGERSGEDPRRLQDLVIEQTKALEEAHARLRLADRMASIGTLAAGLGHDLNNMLLPVRAQINVLLTASSRLQSTALDPKSESGRSALSRSAGDIHAAVQSIAASVAYLERMAGGLQHLAQDPEGTRPDEAETDLADWWARSGSVIGKAVPGHVKVSASIPDDLAPVTLAPHRLSQAVLNLVVNAGEAIPTPEADPTRKRRQGRVQISARTETDDAGHAWVLLAVTDNGTGMTPEVRRRAFELFFTTKSRGHGTGLGLSLVHGVAARVGGRVDIDSEVGVGTTVTMRLPAVTAVVGRSARRAVVTIADARMESLVGHVLEAAGVEVASGIQHPVAAHIWVTDAVESRAQSAASDRRAGAHRVIIPPSATLQTIRDLIAEALTSASSVKSP